MAGPAQGTAFHCRLAFGDGRHPSCPIAPDSRRIPRCRCTGRGTGPPALQGCWSCTAAPARIMTICCRRCSNWPATTSSCSTINAAADARPPMIERRSRGARMSRTWTRVVGEFGLQPLSLVGYSWGGLLAMLYAIEATAGRARHAPSRLVLIDPGPVTQGYRRAFEAEFARRQSAAAVTRDAERAGEPPAFASATRRAIANGRSS